MLHRVWRDLQAGLQTGARKAEVATLIAACVYQSIDDIAFRMPQQQERPPTLAFTGRQPRGVTDAAWVHAQIGHEAANIIGLHQASFLSLAKRPGPIRFGQHAQRLLWHVAARERILQDPTRVAFTQGLHLLNSKRHADSPLVKVAGRNYLFDFTDLTKEQASDIAAGQDSVIAGIAHYVAATLMTGTTARVPADPGGQFVQAIVESGGDPMDAVTFPGAAPTASELVAAPAQDVCRRWMKQVGDRRNYLIADWTRPAP